MVSNDFANWHNHEKSYNIWYCVPNFTNGSTIYPCTSSRTDQQRAVFGGQHAPIANLTSISTSIDELPAIAEDFTATWCTNCLKAEAALDELEEEGLVQKYEFHRAPDFEDPLGDEAASTYITERYDVTSPPLVAFNGTIKKIGINQILIHWLMITER